MALDHRLLTEDGRIDLETWRERHLLRLSVGTCDLCTGSLSVDGSAPWSTDWNGTKYLTARCEACGHETVAPNGKVARSRVPRGEAALVR